MKRGTFDFLLGLVLIAAACFAEPVIFLLIVLLVLIGVAVMALFELITWLDGNDEERP